MKKSVNVRFMVLIACTMCAGIAFSCVFTFYRISEIWLLCAIVPAAATVCILTMIKRSWKPLVYIAVMLAVFFAGFYNCELRLHNYSRSVIVNGGNYVVSGKVTEKHSTDSYEYIILDDAQANGQKLDGKVFVNLRSEYGEFCETGYTVEFFAAVKQYDVFPYGELNKNAEDNIKYSCTVSGGLRSEYGFSLFGSVRSAIRNTLFDNLDKDTASICYAMFTGSTYNVDEISMRNFRFGGIAHIFAVSGLHIGIIFGIVNFLCKKLKFGKVSSTVLSIALIVLYAGICGWNTSSLRAVIMCSAAALCKLFFVKYDGLNSLALSVVILTLINPLSLFSAGFQLSVTAVGGIYCFSGCFRIIFAKIKVPNKISSGICTSFGAQLGTLPILLGNFGYLSGAGLLLNILILPVLSALFSLLFVCTATCSAIPAIAPFIIPYTALPMQAVLSFLVGTGFEKALIGGFGAGIFIPLWYLSVLFLSDKINFKLLTRILGTICSAAILAAAVLIQTYMPFPGFKIAVSGGGDGGQVLIRTARGTVLVVTENANNARLDKTLNKYYGFNLKGLIVLGGENCAEKLGSLNINCTDAYICKLYINVQPYDDIEIHYEKDFSLCGIDFEFRDGANLIADLGNSRIGISAGENINIDNCDLLISNQLNTSCKTARTVYFNLKGYEYNTYEYGDIVFRF